MLVGLILGGVCLLCFCAWATLDILRMDAALLRLLLPPACKRILDVSPAELEAEIAPDPPAGSS